MAAARFAAVTGLIGAERAATFKPPSGADHHDPVRHLVDRLVVLARMDRLPEVAPEVVDVAELAGDAIAARAVNGAAVPWSSTASRPSSAPIPTKRSAI
jgi:hypothetical protein